MGPLNVSILNWMLFRILILILSTNDKSFWLLLMYAIFWKILFTYHILYIEVTLDRQWMIYWFSVIGSATKEQINDVIPHCPPALEENQHCDDNVNFIVPAVASSPIFWVLHVSFCLLIVVSVFHFDSSNIFLSVVFNIFDTSILTGILKTSAMFQE